MGNNVSLPFAIALLIPLVTIYLKWATGRGLHAIPTIGPSAPGLSYIGAFRAMKHAKEMIQEGYTKYKGAAFKIPLFGHWLVVVSGPNLITDLHKLPDDQMSFMDAVDADFQFEYTFGPGILDDPHRTDIVRFQLTRNIARFFPAVHDEIVAAFGELVPIKDEWASIFPLQIMPQVVARVSGRVFVGLPMCRNMEYLGLAITHTIDVVDTSRFLSYFPTILRPAVARFINSSKPTIQRGVRILRPIIQERFQDLNEYGEDWPNKPNDVLQWFVDGALARKQGVEDVVVRILALNFAAIHTSSNSFTHALYDLAAHPEHLKDLREEVETVTKAEGWTKAAMNKLRKLDSFMKESQRLNGINSASLARKALVDLTLSDGTVIPAGTMCAAASASTHVDSDNYPNPNIFDPFRFSEMREGEGEGTKHQFVSTSPDYISFGHGRHACPGRFFAANELKAMMAHVVITYDVKFEQEGVRPPNHCDNLSIFPAPTAQVLFRKRRIMPM